MLRACKHLWTRVASTNTVDTDLILRYWGVIRGAMNIPSAFWNHRARCGLTEEWGFIFCNCNDDLQVRFEVVTAVNIKITFLRVVAPWTSVLNQNLCRYVPRVLKRVCISYASQNIIKLINSKMMRLTVQVKLVQSKRIWRWCITLRIADFLGRGLRPSFGIM
jgi:hypothetical protein